MQKSLSTRTHICPHCGFVEDREINAAINILQKGLSTVGYTVSYKLGEFDPRFFVGAILRGYDLTLDPRIPAVERRWSVNALTCESLYMTYFLTAAFYKFVELPDFADLKAPLFACANENQVKGTILLAKEGINATISGPPDGVRALLEFLRSDPRFADLTHKESCSEKLPFYRLKVRLKREIVTMGIPDINPSLSAGKYVKPEDWNKLLDDPDVVVVDARNDYEVSMGTFKGAIDPKTKSFSELPEWMLREAALRDKPKVAMFCTGGIRCEKSTAFLRDRGFDEVYHLEGGILKYLETIPEAESRWKGECFVFDERVSVGHGLKSGTYELCRACRHPISQEDMASELFVRGVSCPKCHGTKSEVKKQALLERQHQIELAKSRNQIHIGARYDAAEKKAQSDAAD